MGDKLKQFIDDHREDFDSENPDPNLFNALQRQFTRKAKKNKDQSLKFFGFIAAIAASLLIVVASLYFILQKTNDPVVNAHENGRETIPVSDPVYAKQIDQYKQIIDFQQAELKKMGNEHPELYHQFTDDIDQLDSAYRVLKITLAGNPNTEMLLQAMIRNLELQTELLNQQLLIIKEIKQKSKA